MPLKTPNQVKLNQIRGSMKRCLNTWRLCATSLVILTDKINNDYDRTILQAALKTMYFARHYIEESIATVTHEFKPTPKHTLNKGKNHD